MGFRVRNNRYLKLIVINIFIFIGLLYVLNLSVLLIYHGNQSIKLLTGDINNEIASLPNYKHIAWAKRYWQEDNELKTEYKSYIEWRRLPYKGETININGQGIRNTPQSEWATEKSPLVVFLGGSTMWGTGVNDANTIPAFFANIANGRYRTVNLAETAYSAFQGYLFLEMQMIKGLKPDIVVSYDGVNDGMSLKSGLGPFSHIKEDQIRAAIQGIDRQDEKDLSFRQFFLGPLEYYIAHILKPKNLFDLRQERIEQTAQALLESWLATKSLSQKHGAEFIAVLQPNAAVGKPYLEHLDLNEERLKVYRHFYPAILKLLQNPKYKDLSGNVLILTDAFDLKDYIYIDFCHVTPNGNKIIAEKIYNHIKNSMTNRKEG